MSDPFEPFDTEATGDPRQRESADLPAPLAEVQQRLQQLRPRQPQLDLALLERLATADPVSPSRAAIGFSKAQFALAVAAAWLCGVIFGAALLLGIGYRSSHLPAQEQLAAGDVRELTPAPLEKTEASNEMAEGGVAADAKTSVIAAADRPASEQAVQTRQFPVAAEPERRDARPTFAGSGSYGLAGMSELDWESPLRANSLRRQRNPQVFIRTYPRSNGTDANLSPLNPSPAVTPAISASAPNHVPNFRTHQPAVPKTRQQWMNDLLAVPPAGIH